MGLGATRTFEHADLRMRRRLTDQHSGKRAGSRSTMRSAPKRCRARRPAVRPVDGADPGRRPSTASSTVSTRQPGHALVDDLGHRPPPVRDHRRAAGHRLHHRQPERLVELDRVQQRGAAAQDLGPRSRADRARNTTRSPSMCGATCSAKYRSSCTMPQMVSGRPARRAISIAAWVPLSGWIRPNATSPSPAVRVERQPSRSTPW